MSSEEALKKVQQENDELRRQVGALKGRLAKAEEGQRAFSTVFSLKQQVAALEARLAMTVFSLKQQVAALEARLAMSEEHLRAARTDVAAIKAPLKQQIAALQEELRLAEDRRRKAQEEAALSLADVGQYEKAVDLAARAIEAAGGSLDRDKVRLEPKLLAEAIGKVAAKPEPAKPEAVQA